MLKKTYLFLIIAFGLNQAFAQVLYSERFNSTSLFTGTFTANATTQTYLYNDLPSGMTAINNGTKIADTLTGNYPFRANGQKEKAWLTYKPAAITNTNDTFAVSTSWVTPSGSSDAWLITPTILNISANSVLSWEAMAPDILNADGYEVYVTTNTVLPIPVVSDFSSSTKLLTITEEDHTWKKRGISLAAFNGLNVRIAFRNVSVDKYQLWLDDIVVENITNSHDAAALVNNTYKYSTTSINNYISATFKNNGYTPINTITINYMLGSNPMVTETQSLTSPINYLESRQLAFSNPFISLNPAYYPLKIWVSAINGIPDQVIANDSIIGSLTLSTAIPDKKILIEQYTSATCGWCPDAAANLNTIVSTNTNVIVAAIHSNDQMLTTDGVTLANDYTSSLPSATIDQYYFPANDSVSIGSSNLDTYITQRKTMNVPATVTITGISSNTLTNQIDATVSATFVGDVKGDYRLNLYIKENNVYGPTSNTTDNGWNQYNFLYNVPSSPYYQKGNSADPNYVMTGNDFKHQYVIEHMAGGAYGTAGVIPSAGGTTNQTYSQAYSYVLPVPLTGEFRYNLDNVYLIALVTEYNADTKQRTVLNSAEVKLTPNPEAIVGIKDLKKDDFKVSVYPNPTSDICHLNYTIAEQQTVKVTLYNTLGELVYIETLSSNPGNITHTLNLNNLPQGNYSVVLAFKNNSVTKKLTIIK